MTTKIFLLAVVMLSSSFSFGCGTENATSESRYLSSNFYGVILNGNAHVIISQGETNAIRVEGDKKNVELLETSVSNGALVINSGVLRNVDVYVTVADINLIEVKGAGRISGSGLINSDMLLIKVTGNGRIDVDVRALSLGMIVNGNGRIYAKGSVVDSYSRIKGNGQIISMHLDSLKQYSSLSTASPYSLFAEKAKEEKRGVLSLHN